MFYYSKYNMHRSNLKNGIVQDNLMTGGLASAEKTLKMQRLVQGAVKHLN